VVESAPAAASVTAPDTGKVIPVTAPAPESSAAPREVRRAVEVVVSPEPSEPTTFRQKLRAEWRTIKEGFAGAGDDFKAVLGFGRKGPKE